MTDTLDRIIYGRAPGDNSSAQPQVLALTGELTEDDARAWRAIAALEPMPAQGAADSLALGIFAGPGRGFILSRAQNQYDDPAYLVYECIGLPRRLLQQAAGHLEPLLQLALLPLPVLVGDPPPVVLPLDTPPLTPWTDEARQAHFDRLWQQYAAGERARVLALLDAALDGRMLLVRGFAGDALARAAWVQGLMALLPACARPDLTFATYVTDPALAHTHIIFCDDDTPSPRWIAGGRAEDLPHPHAFLSPYVQYLADVWAGDSGALLAAVTALEPVAELLTAGLPLAEGLNQVAAQVRLNQRVLAGEDVPVAEIRDVLVRGLPLPAAAHDAYVERLLQNALETRDTEAALLVAMQMDADPALDERLHQQLMEALQTQPDAVYVFVRARLNDAMEIDLRWIERLQVAALASLRVAITAADTPTIINWLRLIAREPPAYGLGEILRQGIMTAQVRAHDDGELARQLLALTVKRDPQIIDHLLNDELLLAAVPENMGAVLRDYSGDVLLTLKNRGAELFLVAMARATRARGAHLFSDQSIEQVWRLYTAGQTFNLPAHYQPESIVETWADAGTEWLPLELVEKMATLMLADGRDSLFYRLAAQLAARDALAGLLPAMLQASQRSPTDLLSIINYLTGAGQISPQQAVDTLIELISIREWRQNALPLVEHLARLVQQTPTLDIPTTMIWRLLDHAATSRAEPVARVAARQLFSDIEAHMQSDEPAAADSFLVETLLRLFDQLQWSSAARQFVLNWWRDFVRAQPMGRLGRLEKALEGRRALEDCRVILQSTLGFRRMLGKRTLEEFARDINTAYSVLQDIADSFDPSPRRAVSFDVDTIRAELNARKGELPDEALRILATNFRELAQLIGEMGDNRSKANLMRRGENIDRQLMSGEQQPDSAVDVMKWLAGYLDGVHDRDEDSKD